MKADCAGGSPCTNCPDKRQCGKTGCVRRPEFIATPTGVAADESTSAAPDAWADVIAERRRQMTVEGWTPQHDDEHTDNEMARAAESYAHHYRSRGWTFDASDPSIYCDEEPPNEWPWDDKWWKPKSPRRDLVRAAALLLAEIERLDRATSPSGERTTAPAPEGSQQQ